MTVKLILLKSGEDIISDVQEMIVGDSEEDQRVIGYLLKKPYIVKIKTAEVLFENTTSNGNNVAVTFYPYMPLSDEKNIRIPCDWVVTMVEPVKQVKEMYEERINELSKDTGNDEQSDSDQSD